MTLSLLAMAERLRALGVTRVVMEATGVIRGSNRCLSHFRRSGPLRTCL